MRRQQKPHYRFDPFGGIDLLDQNRAQLDRGRQAFDVMAAARPDEFDLLPTHTGLRHAGGLAALGRNMDPLPHDIGQRRHRGEEPDAIAHDAVVISAPEKMDVSGAGRHEFLVNVALAVVDDSHHRRFGQHAVRRKHAFDPASGFLRRDRAWALAFDFSRLAPSRRRLLPAVDVGVREPKNAARVANLTWVAVACVQYDHRMQKKPDIAFSRER